VAENRQDPQNQAKGSEAQDVAPAAAAPPGTDGPAAPPKEWDEGRTAQLRAELEEAKDRALRYQAELENYRKRAARQIEEERRYASMGLMRDLLPVWDNTIRAIEAAEKTRDIDGLVAGIKMVADQLERALQRHDCARIAALHHPFDPHLHQAISQMPSPDFEPNTVIAVAQEGFQLHDRVVRPSQVIVASGTSPAEPSEPVA